MSSSLQPAVELLDALARMNERFVALEQRFWTQPGIARVNRAMDVRRYAYGLSIDAYVDVETSDGNSMAWLLEILWDAPRWIVSARVTTNRGDHEELVMRHPDIEGTSLEGRIAALADATTVLIESAESPKWVA